ncbi:hypothetical protein ACWEKT_33045 [Nocardia takedensis]
MNEHPATRSINVGGAATGQFNTGDHSVLTNAPEAASEALRAFVELVRRELTSVALTPEQVNGTRAALTEIDELASTEPVETGPLRSAFARLVSFLADAGQPALTAVFMALALNHGLALPPG